MTSSANSLLEVLDEFRTYVFVPGLTQIIFAELIRGSPWIIASNKTGQIKSARTSVVLYRTKVLMMYAYCYANYWFDMMLLLLLWLTLCRKLKIKWLQGNKTGCLNQPRQRGHLSEMKHFGLVIHNTENENKSSSLPLSRLMRWWIHLCKSYEEFWTLSGPVHKPATTNLPRLETTNTYHTKPCNKTGGNRNFKSGEFSRLRFRSSLFMYVCANRTGW